MRKNPENKLLCIKRMATHTSVDDSTYVLMLSNLAIAESNLILAKKDSAEPHFIAIVKELERIAGFGFEIIEETQAP